MGRTPVVPASSLPSTVGVACGLERLAPERQGPTRHPEKESRYCPPHRGRRPRRREYRKASTPDAVEGMPREAPKRQAVRHPPAFPALDTERFDQIESLNPYEPSRTGLRLRILWPTE